MAFYVRLLEIYIYGIWQMLFTIYSIWVNKQSANCIIAQIKTTLCPFLRPIALRCNYRLFSFAPSTSEEILIIFLLLNVSLFRRAPQFL